MQRVKLFKSVESDVSKLENEINGWLESSGVRVVSVTGNIAPQTSAIGGLNSGSTPMRYPPSDLFVIVVYEAA